MQKAREICSSNFTPCLAVKYVLSMMNIQKIGKFSPLNFFRQLLRQWKLKVRKILTRVFNFCHLAMQRKLNMWTLLTRKFPDLHSHIMYLFLELWKWGTVYLVSSSSLRTRISSSLTSWGGSCCRDWEQIHRMAQNCSLKTTHSYQIAKNKWVYMPASPPSFYFPHTIATINDSSTFISSLKVKWALNVVKDRTDVLLPGHLDLWYQPMGHTPCWENCNMVSIYQIGQDPMSKPLWHHCATILSLCLYLVFQDHFSLLEWSNCNRGDGRGEQEEEVEEEVKKRRKRKKREEETERRQGEKEEEREGREEVRRGRGDRQEVRRERRGEEETEESGGDEKGEEEGDKGRKKGSLHSHT